MALWWPNTIITSRRRCYHIYSSHATIFYFSDTVHFSVRSLTYEMLRWAVLMYHYYISGLLYSPMLGLSLRTLRFEDQCSHLWFMSLQSSHWCLVVYQFFLIGQMVSQMDYIAWLGLRFLYCVMIIIALILIFVTCSNLWYHDLAVIIIWTWMYFVLCIDVPT